jgi:sortase A
VPANSARPMTRWLERALLATGIVCLSYYGYQVAEARYVQREASAALEATLASAYARANSGELRRDLAVAASGREGGPSAPDAALALLEIPRLKVSNVVMSGDDPEVLDVAIGHLPDTPKPWELGNSALAAHRDGLFRPLRRIRLGDEIRVRTAHGDFTYRVRDTKIVAPDDLSVLAPTETPTLTLITCYPFNFVGSAPKRFIVHAERVDTALSTQ